MIGFVVCIVGGWLIGMGLANHDWFAVVVGIVVAGLGLAMRF